MAGRLHVGQDRKEARVGLIDRVGRVPEVHAEAVHRVEELRRARPPVPAHDGAARPDDQLHDARARGQRGQPGAPRGEALWRRQGGRGQVERLEAVREADRRRRPADVGLRDVVAQRDAEQHHAGVPAEPVAAQVVEPLLGALDLGDEDLGRPDPVAGPPFDQGRECGGRPTR